MWAVVTVSREWRDRFPDHAHLRVFVGDSCSLVVDPFEDFDDDRLTVGPVDTFEQLNWTVGHQAEATQGGPVSSKHSCEIVPTFGMDCVDRNDNTHPTIVSQFANRCQGDDATTLRGSIATPAR